ncbi:MAG: response regulator [Hyphomicrobiaceae bacterium]
MTRPIRVAVVDDHPLFREGVRQALMRAPGIKVVGQGASGRDAQAIAASEAPDIILMDLNMPGGGVETAMQIAKEHPDIKIAFLTVSECAADVAAAVDCGAKGYILKGLGGAELIRIVRALHGGESYIAPSLAAHILRQLRRPEPPTTVKAPEPELTGREEEILSCVSEGMTNKEIGRRLLISDKTVKHHMGQIMSKLQVRNRVEAALKRRRE